MRYTVHFQEPLATQIEVSGGKGANLAWLAQNGFPVPPGFTVTAQAYQRFLAAGAPQLEEVAHFDFANAARLRQQSEDSRRQLGALALPEELLKEVRTHLGAFPAGQAFSVRSSSTMEDLASAAFAGQHDTFLNCSGTDQILEKIKACFLSLWADRALAYRQQHGFDHRLAAMAVVVQEMVPCEVAGVGFSINPVTGDLKEMVIDANFGLGESVVSGETAVDHFLIDKPSRSVRSAQIAPKKQRIVGVAGGTSEVQVSDQEANRPCLDEGQLRQLAALLVEVETRFRFPQDIEWGFAGGKLFLLQSRPITTVPARWTRDESAERFPHVITPLTWDFVETAFHHSLAYSFRLMGFPPFNGKWFGMHGHYIYGNQNAVELYGARAPFLVRNLEELSAAIPRLRQEYRWVQELPVLWLRDLDHYLIRIGEFLAEPLEARTIQQVWQYVMAVNEHGGNYFRPNIAISITHSTLYRVLHYLLQMALGADKASRLFDHLMAFCETKTGLVNKELFELAVLVRAQPELEKTLAGQSSRQLVDAKALERFPEFNARFQKFLRDHGHRELEFDAYVPTWLEAPWAVLDNVRLILQNPMDIAPAAKERELKIRMQEAELELYRSLPENLHFFFAEILRLARVYTSLDDLEHYQTTRLTLPLRKGLRELGRRLVERGFLGEPMDIFFAHKEQIDSAVREDNSAAWTRLGAAVREQKQAYRHDQNRKPQWILGQTESEPAAGAEFLSGLAGSPGEAEGAVFLVLGSEDFARFPKGAVLVARTTNPTWTPLFYSAAAVITESGGPLSHGAVTAREMRIPAVMSVREVLSKLKNGQRVRVDGTRGRVYVEF